MHGWYYWSGLDGTGPIYAFMSGPGPFLEGAAFVGTLWHHLNCHEPGCWRLARHHDPLTQSRYCGRHKLPPAR